MGHVTTDYEGILGTLDGETVTMAAFGAAMVPPTATVPLAGLGTPLDSATTTATWNAVNGRLNVADLTGITADDVAYWVCAYDPGSGLEVVSTITLTDPPSYDDETVQFVTGVAKVERDLVAQVTALTAAVAALSGGGGGGGSGTYTTADLIDETGDSSPTIAVDLSGLDDSDVSVVVALASTCTELQLTMPDHVRQSLTVVSAGGSASGWTVDAIGGGSITTGTGLSSVIVTFVPADVGWISWVPGGAPFEVI
jgi:hypothetical protein